MCNLRSVGLFAVDIPQEKFQLRYSAIGERQENIMKRHAGEASFSKDEKILNTGLSLAMDWGPDWLRPIQERLSKTALELTKEELDQYNSICQEAMKYGHEKIHELAEKYGSRIDREEFYRAFKERYGWATKENMDHCFSQGMYYAWKDGLV